MEEKKKQLLILMYLTKYAYSDLCNRKLSKAELKHLYNLIAVNPPKLLLKQLNVKSQTIKMHRNNIYKSIKKNPNFKQNLSTKDYIYYKCIYEAMIALIPDKVFEKLSFKNENVLKEFKLDKNQITLPFGVDY